MPSLSREEIEKIIIDLREKTELNWRYIEREKMDGALAPSIFVKMELSGQSIPDNTGFHQKSGEECQGIKKNYEQQLRALFGINPDEIKVSVI